jgi:hypothetical protein
LNLATLCLCDDVMTDRGIDQILGEQIVVSPGNRSGSA